MADLDDFFKKKDKKKKGEKKFAKANTDVLAKNLEQMAVKEEKAMEKEISEMNNDSPNTPLNQQVCCFPLLLGDSFSNDSNLTDSCMTNPLAY